MIFNDRTDNFSVNNTPSNLDHNNTVSVPADRNDNMSATVEKSCTNPSQEQHSNDIDHRDDQRDDTNVESLTAGPSTAELANIEATVAAAKVTNDKKVINADTFHETGLESHITTTSSIFQSYNETSQFTTTTTKGSSGFTNIHENRETFICENSNQHEEITIQAETQSLSQVSLVAMPEERKEERILDVQKTINFQDKCEDRTEMSENFSTKPSVPQPNDKNTELSKQEVDQSQTDGRKDKDKDNGSIDECEGRGFDKDETPVDRSTEENDKKSSETVENEKKQNINEGEQGKVWKKNKTRNRDLFYNSDSLISLFNVLAKTEAEAEETNDTQENKNNIEEAEDSDETVNIEANGRPVEVRLVLVNIGVIIIDWVFCVVSI